MTSNDVDCVIFCLCLIGAVSLMFEGSQKNCYFLQNQTKNIVKCKLKKMVDMLARYQILYKCSYQTHKIT